MCSLEKKNAHDTIYKNEENLVVNTALRILAHTRLEITKQLVQPELPYLDDTMLYV